VPEAGTTIASAETFVVMNSATAAERCDGKKFSRDHGLSDRETGLNPSREPEAGTSRASAETFGLMCSAADEERVAGMKQIVPDLLPRKRTLRSGWVLHSSNVSGDVNDSLHSCHGKLLEWFQTLLNIN
jgi:hypothetical protein